MFEKLIGLSFVSLICDILLTGSEFKKYIKSLVGAVFVLTLLNGFFNFSLPQITLPDEKAFEIEGEKYEEEFYENLREEVILNTEKAIREKFSQKNIGIESITIDFDEEYSVKKIEISLSSYSKDKDKAIELLVNYFMIDKEVVSLCQG